jgi:hypothetical protein
MGQIVKFGCLVGLRPAEIVESVRLINDKEGVFAKYYNAEQMVLEHYKFPDVFLRFTKKAFISFMTGEMLDIVKLPVQLHRSVPLLQCNQASLSKKKDNLRYALYS